MKRLATARLQLLPAEPRWAVALADFYARNAAHLAPWDPRRPGMGDPARQVEMLSLAASSAAEGHSQRWLLSLDGGARVVGLVGISNIVRGYFQSAALGYALDARFEGQGLMSEALQAVLGEAFSPSLNLHRLQAAHLPENERSSRLLKRLGFRTIGLAQDHLCINGQWRDHVLTELLNPGFMPPDDWA